MFSLVRAQAPRFDTTFLAKQNAYPEVKAAGPVRLYKMAWYLHFKEIVRQVSEPDDVVYAIVGALHTHNKRDAIRHAIEDVCRQSGYDGTIVPCIWEAPSSLGHPGGRLRLVGHTARHGGAVVPLVQDLR